MTGGTVRPVPWRYTGRSEGISQVGSHIAFVQFTQPDDQPIVINTDRIVTAAPAPPDEQGSPSPTAAIRKERIADVVRRLNIKV